VGSVAAWVLLPLGSNPTLLAEISDDSNSLRDLHKAFVTSVSDKIQVCNFFEQRKTRILSVGIFNWEEFVSTPGILPSWKDGHLTETQCVTESSATFDNADNVAVPVDHYGLNKFQKESNNYTMVIGRLAKLITSLLFSKQKQYLSVPPSKIDTYTERPTLSSAVVEKLRILHDKADVPRALAIHGLGGCGKTQLALKYIEDHRAEYRTILWIDAKDETTTRSSFERCTYDLQLRVESSQTQSSKLGDHPAVRAVFHWLGSQNEIEEEWLIIFDNADDVTWGLKEVIPRGSHGTILLTSQDNKSRQVIRGGCEELHVDTLEPEEARTLLLRHLQLDDSEMTKEILYDCEAIAQQLGYLALAVGLAGAYIANSDEEKPDALRQYLKDFSGHRDELLKHQHYQGLSDHDKTVWTVWDTTLTRIEETSPDLRPGLLLAFLARFDGAVIQDEVLRLASIEMNRVHEVLYPDPSTAPLPGWLTKALALATTGKECAWDDFYYRKSRDILVRYNLLQRVQGSWPGVSMHGLVRWRAQRYAQASESWHITAVISACVTTTRTEKSPRFRRELAAHIPPVGPKRLTRLGIGDTGKDFVWNITSTMYRKEGNWKKSGAIERRMLSLRTEMLGEEHPETLLVLGNVAAIYRNQWQWNEAEYLQTKILDICTRTCGPEHPDTLYSMSALASTYLNQDRFEDAEALELRVFEARTRLLGEDDPLTLDSVSALASMYSKEGMLEKAEPLRERDVKGCVQLFGEEHPDTLVSKLKLASIYSKQKRFDEAEKMQVQVTEAMTEILGPDHHHTLSSMAGLAQTYWWQERWGEAEELEKKVLKGRMRLDGPDDPLTLDTIACLASTYRNQGKHKEAEELEAGQVDLDHL
jgi:tetratricopeptide (TPR) repeat protein